MSIHTSLSKVVKTTVIKKRDVLFCSSSCEAQLLIGMTLLSLNLLVHTQEYYLPGRNLLCRWNVCCLYTLEVNSLQHRPCKSSQLIGLPPTNLIFPLPLQLKESAAALANTKSELAELTAANTAFKAELQSLQESGNEGKEPASTEPSIQSQDLQADLSALKQELTAAKQKLESQDRKLKASSADVERLRAAAAELERSNDSLQVRIPCRFSPGCRKYTYFSLL